MTMGTGKTIKSVALAILCLGAVIDYVHSTNDKVVMNQLVWEPKSFEHSVALPQRINERNAIALLTVPLRSGGLRKCTGAAIGPREVLVAINCLTDLDESKFVQVQVPSSSAPQQVPWAPGKPQKDSHRKKVESGGPHGKKNKYPKSSESLQTRFSRNFVRLAQDTPGGATLALLVLTAPLDKEAWLPVAAEQAVVRGNTSCRLYAWGGTKDLIPEARLGKVEALAGNWTSCWQRAGSSGYAANVRADRRLCALALGCLPPGTGAALVCGPRGSLTGLVSPVTTPAKALNAIGKDQCAAAALQMNAVAPMVPYIRATVPQVSLAPSGLRPDGQVLPALGPPLPQDNAAPHRHQSRRRPRSARHEKRSRHPKKFAKARH